MPFQGAEKSLALNRERPGIVVRLAVNQQKRSLDFVRIRKRGHFVIHLWRLPVGALLILEPKRSERAIVSTAARDASLEKVAVSQQIRGHERAVGMPHYGDTIPIDNTKTHAFINSSLRASHKLVDIRVVGLRVPFPDDRNAGIFEHRV